MATGTVPRGGDPSGPQASNAATSTAPPLSIEHAAERGIWRVIAAASAGTVIEWYDFYIFGALASIIASEFYPTGDATANFLKTLATFGAGFAIRPLGALVFGRLGDLVGRKYTFLITLLLMGTATAAIGIVPTYAQIGLAAPLLLVACRLLQGLALGGEYGGAAVYVAEHAPDGRRGYYTSFIQTTASLGLFLSLGVVLGTRSLLGEAAFRAWGWRVPFLLSVVLIAISYLIRRRMQESPLFAMLKARGKTSRAPIRDAYRTAAQWKTFAVVLFGLTAGQAVIFYTSQFYVQVFLEKTLQVPSATTNLIVATAILVATPSFVFFGALSDRIGRKRVMITGNLLAALCWLPIYHAMSAMATPVRPVMLGVLVAVQVLFVAMTYGPIAAYLVEAFPARVRYTSLSLPYHLGNGWFGGFTPLIAASLTASTGNRYAGLWYPIAIALMTVVVGGLFAQETRDRSMWQELDD
ncbi:MAG: MHS family MFS transporter [Gemmatimonadaceae bacterium]|jgi:MFS family permease|nr:MHS family MFS transporter [Gemmatimonadaceae bacterium]